MNYPNNIDLEKGVLGYILTYSNEFFDISTLFSDSLFYDDRNKIIAKSIIAIKEDGKPLDVLTSFSWIKTNGFSNEFQITAFYLSQLQSYTPSSLNIKHHLMILKELSIKREIINTTYNLLTDAQNDSTDCFELLERANIEVSKISESIIVKDFYTTERLMRELHERNNAIIENKGKIIGVTTGYKELDKITGGLYKGNLIIICGRSGMGKTAFAGCMATNACYYYGTKVGVFSLEMPSLDIWCRCMATITGLDLHDFTRHGFSGEKSTIVSQMTDKILKMPFYLDDTPNIKFNELKQKCRRLVKEKKVEIIYIDYLQLIRYDSKTGTREQEITKISNGLKALSKELNIPIVALAQLNREVDKRPDKIPTSADLRESAAIEQDADLILSPWRGDIYGIKEYNGIDMVDKAIIFFLKNRNGGIEELPMNYIGSKTTFTEITTNIPF